MDRSPRFARIKLGANELRTVFDLLGTKENDITKSVGWALSRSPALLDALAVKIGAGAGAFDEVRLQGYDPKTDESDDQQATPEGGTARSARQSTHGGYTDIELVGREHHVIVEAKRGWWLPEDEQLRLYARRFEDDGRDWHSFVVMSDCSRQYAVTRLPDGGYPVHYFAWREFAELARNLGSTHAEKRLVNELCAYLNGVATMSNKASNMVFVVSLGRGAPSGGELSWVEIVRDKRRYFHPVGSGWPKEPPNYIAFRYMGQLQSIHHVDDCIVSSDSADMPGLPPSWDWTDRRTGPGTGPHFLYTLGTAMMPSRPVKTGKGLPMATHAYVMLDLLLTCETITDALRQTKLRMTRRPRSQLRSPPPVDGRFDCASASSRLFVNCDESQDESIGPFQRLICGQSDCMDNSKLWSDPRRPCWASVR